MTTFGNIAKGVIDLITPDGATERLIFKRYPGSKIIKALETGAALSKSDIEVVALKINPQEIQYAERKISTKVQTASPGRFMVFDWGSELLVLTIQGATGNLLPTEMANRPIMGAVKDIGMKLGISGSESIPTIMPGLDYTNMMINSMSYYDILDMSPKYKVFAKLRDMYHKFDADSDILTLEMGDVVYRGFFEDFQFTVTSESPWNWKYSVVFVSMENLADLEKRGDEDMPDNSNAHKV